MKALWIIIVGCCSVWFLGIAIGTKQYATKTCKDFGYRVHNADTAFSFCGDTLCRVKDGAYYHEFKKCKKLKR